MTGHATGWSWILEGGIPSAERIKGFPPLKGQIGTPRLAVGQIDCIRIACVLKPLTKSLLKVLMGWIADRQYDRWMSIFFATFILLSELAKATEDAYEHGWYDKDLRRNVCSYSLHYVLLVFHAILTFTRDRRMPTSSEISTRVLISSWHTGTITTAALILGYSSLRSKGMLGARRLSGH